MSQHGIVQAFDFAFMTIVTMTSFLTVLSLATLCYGAAVPRADDATSIMRLPVTRMQKTGTLASRQINTGLSNPENGTIYIVDREYNGYPAPWCS
jgi:hypothetical protein